MRPLLMGLFLGTVLPPLGGTVAAQELEEASPQVATPQNALALGLAGFMEDGDSQRRLAIWWYGSPAFAVGATGRWWGDYDIVEPEMHWYPAGRTDSAVFLTASGIWKQGGRYGFSAGVGYERFAAARWSIGGTFAWESHFGGLGSGPHWFRLQAYGLFIPPL